MIKFKDNKWCVIYKVIILKNIYKNIDILDIFILIVGKIRDNGMVLIEDKSI